MRLEERVFKKNPDPYDSRDFLYADKLKERAAVTTAPVVIDLSKYMPGIRNQGRKGACTGFGARTQRMYYAIKLFGDHAELAPDYVYAREQILEGTRGKDTGALVRDGQKVMQQFGICPESFMPYNENDVSSIPSAEADAAAAAYKTDGYFRARGLAELKAALQNEDVVNGGIAVFESFEGYDVANFGGIVPMPKPGEKLLGYHDIVFCGCDDVNRRVKFANSWDVPWGDKGYGYLPYDYIDNADYTPDLWVAEVKGPVNPPTPPSDTPPWANLTNEQAVHIIAQEHFQNSDLALIDSPDAWIAAVNAAEKDPNSFFRFSGLQLRKYAARLLEIQKLLGK